VTSVVLGLFSHLQGYALVKDGLTGPVLQKVLPGQYFGERALLGAEVRA
jgi:hypothetical protein